MKPKKRSTKAAEENFFTALLKQREKELNKELAHVTRGTEGQLYQVSAMLRYATIQIQVIMQQESGVKKSCTLAA